MDQVLSILIRLIVFIARFSKPLSHLGIGSYEERKDGEPLKILLVGYNGARNTGADARVVAIARQLKTLFGPGKVQITVMTLHKDRLEGYFDNDVLLQEFSSVFLWDLYRACCVNHAALLCEGSTLKSTFANALTLFLCEAAGIMAAQGKPCLAYGSEVGKMDRFLQKFASRLCRDCYFIVRTEDSYQELTRLGLRGHVGTDTAWFYDGAITKEEAEKLLRGKGWDGKKPLLGVAVINPFCWPVKASLWKWVKSFFTGPSPLQYDKIYFFSDSPDRRKAFEKYIGEVAGSVKRFCAQEDCFPVIIGMERLDAQACAALKEKLSLPCALFLSREETAQVLTGILRRLSYLVTSRYHAAVLSMEGALPLVGISMDERLDGILKEVSLDKDYLHHVAEEGLGEKIFASLCKAKEHREEIHSHLQGEVREYRQKLYEMGTFLMEYLEECEDRSV